MFSKKSDDTEDDTISFANGTCEEQSDCILASPLISKGWSPSWLVRYPFPWLVYWTTQIKIICLLWITQLRSSILALSKSIATSHMWLLTLEMWPDWLRNRILILFNFYLNVKVEAAWNTNFTVLVELNVPFTCTLHKLVYLVVCVY